MEKASSLGEKSSSRFFPGFLLFMHFDTLFPRQMEFMTKVDYLKKAPERGRKRRKRREKDQVGASFSKSSKQDSSIDNSLALEFQRRTGRRNEVPSNSQ